jgi:hypothetical protein
MPPIARRRRDHVLVIGSAGLRHAAEWTNGRGISGRMNVE